MGKPIKVVPVLERPEATIGPDGSIRSTKVIQFEDRRRGSDDNTFVGGESIYD
jgi:hypothetical protein